MFREKIAIVLDMHKELMEVLTDNDLKKKLPRLRSNTLEGQLKCLAGTRESYYNNLVNDSGFAWDTRFDFSKNYTKEEISVSLEMYRVLILEYIDSLEVLSNNQQGTIMDLMAHEYMHQGQIIRYLYALELDLPKSFVEFWHLPR